MRLTAQAEQTLYFNRITLAHQYWRADNVAQVDRTLALCPPELRGWEWRYLRRLAHGELYTLQDNDHSTKRVSVSRDGRRLAAIGFNSGDTGARVWDLTANKAVAEVAYPQVQPKTPYGAVALSPDGATLALGDGAGVVTLWDAADGKKQRDLGRILGPVGRLSFHPTGTRLAASGDKGLKVWDFATGRELLSRTDIVSADFLPDGRHLVVEQTAAGPRPDPTETRLQLVDADGLEGRRELGRAHSTRWSATPSLLALGHDAQSSQMIVIEIATGRTVFTATPNEYTLAVALHPSGALLAHVPRGSTVIEVWDTQWHYHRHKLYGHTDMVTAVQFLPDGRLVSCARDGTIKVWDATASTGVTRQPGEAAATVSAAAYSPDGARLAVVQGNDMRAVTAAAATVTAAAYSPDITRLAVVPAEYITALAAAAPVLDNPGMSVTIWDPAIGRAVQRLRGHTDVARRVAFAADGRRLVSGGEGGWVIVWDTVAGKAIANWRGHDGPVEGLALSPDGKWVASSPGPKGVAVAGGVEFKMTPGEVKVWDAATGAARFTLSGSPIGLAFSPDGRLLAANCGNWIQLWDAVTGAERGRLVGRQVFGTQRLVFSPDGKTLLAAGYGNEPIHLWDVDTGAVRCSLVGHLTARFGGAAFSPDGRLVATGVGHEVKLWDATTGREVFALLLPDLEPFRSKGIGWPDGVATLAFSPDGRKLQAVIRDGVCIAWDAPPVP
jgi:WD40 repeat protein